MIWGKNRSKKKRNDLIHLFMVMTLISLSPSVSAELANSPASSPKNASLDDFGKICDPVLNDPQAAANQSTKLQYCQAAKSAKEAANSNGTLWKVWAAVSGVCLVSCSNMLFGQNACTGSSVAAGVTQGVITKNFSSAMMSIAGAGMGHVLTQQTKKPDTAASTAKASKTSSSEPANAAKAAEKSAEKSSKSRNWGACLTAAMAGFQSYNEYNAMKAREDEAKNALTQAANLLSSAAAVSPVPNVTLSMNGVPSAGSSGSSGGTGTTGIANSNPNSSSGSSASSAASNPCQNANTVGSITQCAVASDSRIPPNVTTPQFSNDFRRASGTDLGSFFNNAKAPGPAITSASGSLSPDQKSKLDTALRNLETQLSPQVSSTYQAGGRGAPTGGGGDGGSEAALAESISNVMGSLLPKTDEGKSPNQGINMLIFEKENRSPAEVPEDKSLSIFARISFRYNSISKTFLEGGQSP